MDTVLIAEENRLTRVKVSIPMLWLAIVAMIMLFASLTSAYVVSWGKGGWLQFELPRLFYVSTAIIITSSVTMNWTLLSARKNDFRSVKIAAVLTLLLGVAFMVSQCMACAQLVEQKVFFAGKSSNVSGSYLYALTGLHLAHLVFAIMAVMVVLIKSAGQKYSSENLLGIKLCSIFWHFLDALWVFLFLFLFFVR